LRAFKPTLIHFAVAYNNLVFNASLAGNKNKRQENAQGKNFRTTQLAEHYYFVCYPS
jgi:hypothetical protein